MHSPHPPNNQESRGTPAKIDVAFRSLAYCRSVSDPTSLGLQRGRQSGSRPLTIHERGVEIAALNLIRNWLNGETDLSPDPSPVPEHLDNTRNHPLQFEDYFIEADEDFDDDSFEEDLDEDAA